MRIGFKAGIGIIGPAGVGICREAFPMPPSMFTIPLPSDVTCLYHLG